MALKLSCPHCGQVHRLASPMPQPGSELQCWCGRVLSISYPPGLVEKLRGQGVTFEGDAGISSGTDGQDQDAPTTLVDRSPAALTIGASTPVDEDAPTTILRRDEDPTAAAAPTPQGRREVWSPTPRSAAREPSGTVDMGSAAPGRREPVASSGGPPVPPAKAPAKAKKKGGCLVWVKRLIGLGVFLGIAGVGALAGAFAYYSQDLPTLEELANYRPPTVTMVYDRDGRVLGEIYEKRRYVVDLEEMPQHLKDSFLAAEDASFYEHGGVDPMGILRAIIRNAVKGKKAQGASTITQQTARNFLLSSEKRISRKIKEMILATRIEEAFDKDYILHLYLNQIYLGSGAYGVEAAARIYFGKNVGELTLAESALLAGLPQRPSDYSPHRHFEKARARQEYVIGQLVDKGFIAASEGERALAEHITVVKEENPIKVIAPTYTEHVRRHLVDTYGFDRVYNEGLVVHTTANLELQGAAQEAVVERVTEMDQKIGWRGKRDLEDPDNEDFWFLLESISEGEIAAWRDEQETALREDDQFREDPARRTPVPERSTLRVDRYDAVVLAVEKKHAVVGIGAHEAMIPLSWTDWAYTPNPKQSWRYRAKQSDLTEVLQPGDLVTVDVVDLDSQNVKELKGYAPASDGTYAAAKLYQDPALEGAFFGYDLETGMVGAMVGGTDIEKSEFNRAFQAQRQVGSTFKPIVYAAAIESEQYTVGSMVQDAPLIFNTLEEKLWKPGNYGDDYMGNISLRKALALSRNVCTVRVLDTIGLDPVEEMARRLGIESHLEKDLSMGLGSNSLTLWELARAYSVFATYGEMVHPYLIDRVEDRDGNVLEKNEPAQRDPVLDPTVAGITTWLLREVATSGTAAATNRMGLTVAGKTGTTNDFKDGWFVGFSPDHLGVAWVGYDKPRSMGISSTGGRTALPIWMDYMSVAVPKEANRPFPEIPGAQWAQIDEATGRRASGGRGMPFLPGTVPDNVAAAVGQVTADDLLTSDF